MDKPLIKPTNFNLTYTLSIAFLGLVCATIPFTLPRMYWYAAYGYTVALGIFTFFIIWILNIGYFEPKRKSMEASDGQRNNSH